MMSAGDASSIQQAAYQSQIQIALQAKQLDTVRAQGDAAVRLLEAAAQLSKAVGKGQNFDALG